MLQWLADKLNQVDLKEWDEVPSRNCHGGISVLKHTAVLNHSSLAITVCSKNIQHAQKQILKIVETTDTGIYPVPNIENCISLKEINWWHTYSNRAYKLVGN